jgi:putative tricarboxylic transport membrane protein
MNVEVINFSSLFFLDTFLVIFLGTLSGIVIGALPGLTATMAVSIMVSFTYGMSARNALAMLIALYLGGIYGGSRSAILLNVPGTPSSAATALDGWPLTMQGKGSFTGIVATTVSALGGLVGLVFLGIATPIIANFALEFSSWEYFWLAIFGVVISGNIAGAAPYKGFMAGFIGLFVSTIGMDPLHGTIRYTFGLKSLIGGISLVPAMIGLFGLTEAFITISDPEAHLINHEGQKYTIKRLFNEVKDSFIITKRYFKTFMASSVIGTLIGALPGVGPDIASWVSYDTAKRTSKEKEKFGHGSIEGIVASETGNNAATSGVFIPLLTLGIPGCAVSAIILGGIQLHGYRPGPIFFLENTDFVYFVCGALLIVNITMFIIGIFLTPVMAKVLTVDSGIIMPIVVVLSVVGSYAINVRIIDVRIMVLFGFMGYFMRKLEIPSAPMALGIILGSLADWNFRRGLIAARYNVLPFFTRPISAVLFLSICFFIIWPFISNRKKSSIDKKGSEDTIS